MTKAIRIFYLENYFRSTANHLLSAITVKKDAQKGQEQLFLPEVAWIKLCREEVSIDGKADIHDRRNILVNR
jgi:hypothetical protein